MIYLSKATSAYCLLLGWQWKRLTKLNLPAIALILSLNGLTHQKSKKQLLQPAYLAGTLHISSISMRKTSTGKR
jgi:hypothetical protein